MHLYACASVVFFWQRRRSRHTTNRQSFKKVTCPFNSGRVKNVLQLTVLPRHGWHDRHVRYDQFLGAKRPLKITLSTLPSVMMMVGSLSYSLSSEHLFLCLWYLGIEFLWILLSWHNQIWYKIEISVFGSVTSLQLLRVGRLVGWSAIISRKGGKLNSYASIEALVVPWLILSRYARYDGKHKRRHTRSSRRNGLHDRYD